VLTKKSAQSVQPFGRLYATYIYTNVLFYYTDRLAEGPGVAREKKFEKNMVKKIILDFLAYNIPRPPMSVHKKCQPNWGPAVWPAIDNIYIRMSCFII